MEQKQNQKKCKMCKKDLLEGTKIPFCQSCRDEILDKSKKGAAILGSAVLGVIGLNRWRKK